MTKKTTKPKERISKVTGKPVQKRNYTEKVGRPTKYKPEYCQQIIEYFTIDPADKSGNANDPRYLSAFARLIDVNHDTLHEWRDTYPEFSAAYRNAKQLQKEHIITNALQNRFNASFAWRAMMNMHQWREKQDIDQKIKLPPGLIISFPSEKS